MYLRKLFLSLSVCFLYCLVSSAQGIKKREIHALTVQETAKIIELRRAKDAAYETYMTALKANNRFEDSIRIRYHTDKHSGTQGDSLGGISCVSNGSLTYEGSKQTMGMDCVSPAEITEDGKFLVDEYYDYRKP